MFLVKRRGGISKWVNGKFTFPPIFSLLVGWGKGSEILYVCMYVAVTFVFNENI